MSSSLNSNQIFEENSKSVYSEGILESRWKDEIAIDSSPQRWVFKVIRSFPKVKEKSNPPLYNQETVLRFLIRQRNLNPTVRNEIAYLNYFVWYLNNYDDIRKNNNLENKKEEIEYLTERLDILETIGDDIDGLIAKSSVYPQLKELYLKYPLPAIKHSYISDFGFSINFQSKAKITTQLMEISNHHAQTTKRTCKAVMEIFQADALVALVCDNDTFRAYFDFTLINLIKNNADPDKFFYQFARENQDVYNLIADWQSSVGDFQNHKF